MDASLINREHKVVEIGENWRDKISHYNKLNQTDYHLRLVTNRGKGNCFFIALEQGLTNINLNRRELRKSAVDYLVNDQLLVFKLLQQNINDYNNDLRHQTGLLNGCGWPKGGPYTIMENLSTDNPILHHKSLQILKKILNKATYYADNEIIEATEKTLNLNIIIFSDSLGEIVWRPINSLENPFVIIYNYDATHYELVEIGGIGNENYQTTWSNFQELPDIIRDFISKILMDNKLIDSLKPSDPSEEVSHTTII